MTHDLIRTAHDDWAKEVIPPGASQIQRQEMERSFFSGALSAILILGMFAKKSDQAAGRALDSMTQELEDYFRLLGQMPPKADKSASN